MKEKKVTLAKNRRRKPCKINAGGSNKSNFVKGALSRLITRPEVIKTHYLSRFALKHNVINIKGSINLPVNIKDEIDSRTRIKS